MRYAAFLRAVNVGAKNRISMQSLKKALEEQGLQQVETYIQSGNIAFECPETPPQALRNKVEQAIAQTFGLQVTALVFTPAYIGRVLQQNPYPAEKAYVALLAKEPAPEEAELLRGLPGKGDECLPLGGAVYVCANGPYHKTVFSNAFLEKKLKTAATTRSIVSLKAFYTGFLQQL